MASNSGLKWKHGYLGWGLGEKQAAMVLPLLCSVLAHMLENSMYGNVLAGCIMPSPSALCASLEGAS